VLGRFVWTHHFKSAAHSMGAIDGKNPRSESWMARGILTASILIFRGTVGGLLIGWVSWYTTNPW
jgi:hypothetical protein